MRRFLAVLVLGCAVMGNAAAWGQAAGATTEPTLFQGIGGKQLAIDVLDVPGNSVTVGKFLGILKQKLPSFQYVANAGKWQDAMLPQLNLRNVTVPQIIDLLREIVPQMLANPFYAPGAAPGERSEFWVFRDQPEAQRSGDGVRLVAFGLNDSIDRLALRKSWSVTAANAIAPAPEQVATSRKEALKEILSLLEASLSQAEGPGTAPSLKLHEETGVLLVKGLPGQINAITQALEALKSGDDPNQLKTKYGRLDSEYESIKNKNNLLQTRNTSLESRNALLESRYVQYEEKIRSLQRELDALKARGGAPATLPGNSNTTEKH
jgi:hypothetical protein